MKKFIIYCFSLLIFAFSVLPSISYAQFADTQSGPQKGLPKSSLVINTPNGARTFSVELANTNESREIGMMWRTYIGRTEGMLFDFYTPRVANFWMKNTLVSLDLIYIRSDGVIATIVRNAKPLDLKPLSSKVPVRAVLEIAGGEADRQGIKEGQTVKHTIFGNNKVKKRK